MKESKFPSIEYGKYGELKNDGSHSELLTVLRLNKKFYSKIDFFRYLDEFQLAFKSDTLFLFIDKFAQEKIQDIKNINKMLDVFFDEVKKELGL